MKDKTIYKIIAIISILCILFSIIIYIENLQLKTKSQDFCSAITGTNGCETVQSSKYSKMFGISNTIYGMTGFTILGIFALLLIYKDHGKTKRHNLRFIRYLTILGGIFSGLVALTFLYLQILVIHAYCIFCLFVDASSIILFGLAIYLLVKEPRHK
jgi:uncharacterized membrane protein